MATKSLLGLGKLIMRLVLLKPNDNADESEKALVGNTILVAQPSPEMIAAELPPTEIEQASYFNVVYGSGASEHGSSKLGKKKAHHIQAGVFGMRENTCRAMPAVRRQECQHRRS